MDEGEQRNQGTQDMFTDEQDTLHRIKKGFTKNLQGINILNPQMRGQTIPTKPNC